MSVLRYEFVCLWLIVLSVSVLSFVGLVTYPVCTRLSAKRPLDISAIPLAHMTLQRYVGIVNGSMD